MWSGEEAHYRTLYRLKWEPFWWRHIDQLREHLARADVDADTTSSDEVSLILLWFRGLLGYDTTDNTPEPESGTAEDTQVNVPTEQPDDICQW